MSETDTFTHRFIPVGKSSPVLLLLHGTGGNEEDLLDLGHSLHPGAALLSPRGKVLENGMPRFFRRLAEGVFDEADLIRRTHELADFVAAAEAEYQLQSRKVVAVGYSNGANIAASLLLLRPETLSGAVPLACNGSDCSGKPARPCRHSRAPCRRQGRPLRSSGRHKSTRSDAQKGRCRPHLAMEQSRASTRP